LDNANPQYQYELGLAQAASDDYAAAAESISKALQLEPNLREAYPPLVQVLLFAKRYDEAWSFVAEGQTRGAIFDPNLILELQNASGQIGPK
jgi:Tfp pilus assembly protein PilF